MAGAVNRRQFFSGLTISAAIFGVSSLAISKAALAAIAAPAKFNYPNNPLHFRAMIVLREAAKKLLKEESDFEMISATCRHLRGETGTYDIWHISMHNFDGLYQGMESLEEMGLSKDEINAALHRLDIEMDIRRVLRADAVKRES